MVVCESIAVVIAKREKNVKGIVIKQSDLKSGTSNNKDWSMRVFTMEDESGTIEITTWNGDVKRLVVGVPYEIESLWWKEHEGKWGASLGKYSKVKEIGFTSPAATSEPPPGFHSDGKDGWIRNEKEPNTPLNSTKLPPPTDALKEFVIAEDVLMLQIEQIITENWKNLGIPTNGQRLGMHSREIYKKATKSNLTKASKIT